MVSVVTGSSFLGVLDDLIHIMILDLLHAGMQCFCVAMLMHGSPFMMCVKDGAGLEMTIIFAGNEPAMLCVLRLKRDAVAAFELYDEVVPVDALKILLCEHRAYLLPLRFRNGCAFAVVYSSLCAEDIAS